MASSKKRQYEKANDIKRVYIPPKFEVLLIEMENGLATGSTQVVPAPQQTTETWAEKEQTGALDW
ncbi:MAG: hypothetical protein LBE39_11810 [Flavobacteriaceae bacterium]|jgi:hypothetical protein|nr:hypothetical protein [Flavobacteriaceae bacterium]